MNSETWCVSRLANFVQVLSESLWVTYYSPRVSGIPLFPYLWRYFYICVGGHWTLCGYYRGFVDTRNINPNPNHNPNNSHKITHILARSDPHKLTRKEIENAPTTYNRSTGTPGEPTETTRILRRRIDTHRDPLRTERDLNRLTEHSERVFYIHIMAEPECDRCCCPGYTYSLRCLFLTAASPSKTQLAQTTIKMIFRACIKYRGIFQQTTTNPGHNNNWTSTYYKYTSVYVSYNNCALRRIWVFQGPSAVQEAWDTLRSCSWVPITYLVCFSCI